jgi:hypothetical protein
LHWGMNIDGDEGLGIRREESGQPFN